VASLEGARVLVTGLSGFVGRHVARVLGARGARLSGLGLDEPPEGQAIEGWFAADLRDAATLGAGVAAAAPDAVVHLAAQSSAARSFEDPGETFTINVTGTWNVLEAVHRHAPRARVLVVGTSEVYGPQPTGTRTREDATFRPVSPYALSKAAADALAERFGREHDLDVVRTRSFGHTGPGQDTRFAVPAWAKQIAAIERGDAEPVLRVGNLDVVRDLCDVRDVAEAYAALLEHGRRGEAYNVCRGEGVKLTHVVERLVALARVPIRVAVDPARLRPADVPYLVGDPAAIEKDAGWRARTVLDRTLEEVLGEWRSRRPTR
jgi:GDP-4-dehydro-6-deoxy-D-mannose reductase